jgi:hypothetical protein
MILLGEEIIISYFKKESIQSLERYRYNINKIIKKKKEVLRAIQVKKDLKEFNKAFQK